MNVMKRIFDKFALQKGRFLLESLEKTVLICGNESCDLDSAVCAFSYAASLSEKSGKNGQFLPLFQVNSDEFHIQTEVVFAFERVFGAKLAEIRRSILFKNELDQVLEKKCENVHLILVDHHDLKGKMGEKFDKSKIVEIIDHRERNLEFLDGLLNCKHVTIENVGSCATLVAEKLENEGIFADFPREFGIFLLSSIYVDTRALESYKKTEKDAEIAAKLKKSCDISDEKIYNLYLELEKAKFDVKTMNFGEILRKDLKILSNTEPKIGISSVPVTVEQWLEIVGKVDFVAEIANFCSSKEIEILLTLTGYSEGENGCRTLLISCSDGDKLNLVENCLRKSEFQLDLELNVEKILYSTRCYTMLNKRISRKQILPILESQF